MSSINKLLIRGIRSFGPDDPQIIQFQAPLTIIVGPNGSGKTTIVECLKYVTSGDMPPGSKGGLFIHDPKLAAELEVRAQIKLQFKDVRGENVVTTRSLVCTQKKKKMEMKTLEGTIKRMSKTGEGVNLSSKCSELDLEMLASLGVSKAILNNVIFCHQEESNWPLSDGKTLKTKFDDIFSATRYIKALDAIRKLRAEQVADTKSYALELKYLKEYKDKAEQTKQEIKKNKLVLESTNDSRRKLTAKYKGLESKLNEYRQNQEKINRYKNDVEKLRWKSQELTRLVEELTKQIETPFEGADEELCDLISRFETEIHKENREHDSESRKINDLANELAELRETYSAMLVDNGKLAGIVQEIGQRAKVRDEKIVSCAEQMDIKGYLKGPFSDEAVKTFCAILADVVKGKLGVADAEKKQREQAINTKEAEINQLSHDVATLEERLRNAKSELNRKEASIRNTRDELKSSSQSAKKSAELSAVISELEVSVASRSRMVNADKENKRIEDLKQMKETLRTQVNEMNDERKKVQIVSKLKSEVEFLKKDLNKKKAELHDFMQCHGDTLTDIFGRMPAGKLSSKVLDHQAKEKETMDRLNDELQECQLQESKLENQRVLAQEQFQGHQKQIQDFKTKLIEIAGSGSSLDTALAKIDTEIAKLRQEAALAKGSEYVYQRFLELMEGQEGTSVVGKETEGEHSCPLCQRGFGNVKEAKECIGKIKQKLKKLPAVLKNSSEKLTRSESHQQKLYSLVPRQEEVLRLETKEIPKLQSSIAQLSHEISEISAKARKTDETKSDLKLSVDLVAAVANDVRDMDRLMDEVGELEGAIQDLYHKAAGMDVDLTQTRTVEEVHSAMESIQAKLNDVSDEIDSRKQRLESREAELLSLRQQLNAAISERLEWVQRSQSTAELSKRLEDATVECENLTDELRQIQANLSPTKMRLDEERAKKRDLEREKDKAERDWKDGRDDLIRMAQEVNDSVKQLKVLRRANHEQKLLENEQSLEQMNNQVGDVEKEKAQAQAHLQELDSKIARADVRGRDLGNELKCREKKRELEVMEAKLVQRKREMQSEVADLDLDQLEAIQNQCSRLQQDIAMAAGKAGELDAVVGRLERELATPRMKKAEESYTEMLIKLKTTEVASMDLQKYYNALDHAIMRFHAQKMEEINKIVKELWSVVYRGHDIDYVLIKSDEEAGTDKRRVYNYRVVMVCKGTELDMRGRCSTGQKVLASLIIRVALAESFCLKCGILALDEPTTNLDIDNIKSLGHALIQIVRSRCRQSNFQLVLITHDEEFVDLLLRERMSDYFYRVHKDQDGLSRLTKQAISNLQ